MRRLALTLLTGSATLVFLAVLALPALRVLAAPAERANAGGTSPRRAFGVYVDPWHVDDWAHNVGAEPQMIAKFESFSRHRSIDDFLDRTERAGITRALISWEPWEPVPVALGAAAQFRPQLGYRNADIAAGWQDQYLWRFARSLARFDGIVYLRYAHEMNGWWYPWSHDRKAYVRAWRHVVRIVRRAGGHNVRFVWSANPSLFLSQRAWARSLRGYWPGTRYVDVVGMTMINFGGQKNYTVARFTPRLRALRRMYRKPLMITEANTQYAYRVQWLRSFRALLRTTPSIRGVAWSQLPSRGKAHLEHVGNLAWDIEHDPAAAAVIRSIINDGRAEPVQPNVRS